MALIGNPYGDRFMFTGGILCLLKSNAHPFQLNLVFQTRMHIRFDGALDLSKYINLFDFFKEWNNPDV